VHWLFFFGRFHVLLVHLPIGIIYVTVALELLARRPRFASLANAAPFLWACAAVTAVITVLLGLAHSTEGGFNPQTLARHRALGISVALLAVGLWALRTQRPRLYQSSQLFTGPLALILVAVTGHYGGDMTHGSGYLFAYAPAPLQRLAGMQVKARPVSVANADVFADVVHPMLMLRCSSCHGDSTRKGGLSFTTYASILKGGEDFPAVVPGDLTQSEMYYRITQPKTSKDFMPRDNKTPLTPDQVQIIGWWIKSGAPGKGTVASLKPPAPILKLIGQQLQQMD
jgi:uncharacterized membrane protein